MTTKTKDKGHVYGEVSSESSLRDVFKAIRRDVDEAKSRDGLTELYRRSGYLVTLTRSPSWKKKFGKTEADELMEVGENEFTRTARAVNGRAREIGTEADYDETWGES